MNDALVIHWPYLLLAAGMLWFPRQWLRNGPRLFKRRRVPRSSLEKLASQGSQDPDDRSVRPRKEFANLRNYLDLFRALAGGHSLSTYAFTATGAGAARTVLLIQLGILLVAVAIQAVRLEGGRHSYFAPIFWFVGLAVGFLGHYAGLFAFALVLAVNPAIPTPRWFLTVYGLVLAAAGFVFGVPLVTAGLVAGLVLLVPLASLLAKRPVVIFSRKPRPTGAA